MEGMRKRYERFLGEELSLKEILEKDTPTKIYPSGGGGGVVGGGGGGVDAKVNAVDILKRYFVALEVEEDQDHQKQQDGDRDLKQEQKQKGKQRQDVA